MTKTFAIYRQPMKAGNNKWSLHGKYDTMSQCVQAWTDLIKKPRKLRSHRYVVLPLLDPKARHVMIKPEHNEEVLRMSR